MNANEFAWDGKVLTEDDLRRVPGTTTVLTVRTGIVITPSARDAIRHRGLQIELQPRTQLHSPVGSSWIWIRSNEAKLASSVMRGMNEIREVKLSGGFLESAIESSRGLRNGPLQGIIAIGEDVEILCVCVNKLPAVKAIAPRSLMQAKRIMKRLAPNFVGLESEALSFHEMVQIVKLAVANTEKTHEHERLERLLAEVHTHANR